MLGFVISRYNHLPFENVSSDPITSSSIFTFLIWTFKETDAVTCCVDVYLGWRQSFIQTCHYELIISIQVYYECIFHSIPFHSRRNKFWYNRCISTSRDDTFLMVFRNKFVGMIGFSSDICSLDLIIWISYGRSFMLIYCAFLRMVFLHGKMQCKMSHISLKLSP